MLAAFMISFSLLTFVSSSPSFSIGNNTFLLDGKAFRYISGSVHYLRVHPDLWRDRLRRVRQGGFNAVQFFVEWNRHERRPGEYDFKGALDLERFIRVRDQRESSLATLMNILLPA